MNTKESLINTEMLLKNYFNEISSIENFEKYNLNNSDIQNLKENDDFRNKLAISIKQKKFDAFQALSLFWENLHAIDTTISDEQWLKKIYNFCQFMSFPDTKPEYQKMSAKQKKIFYIFLLTYRQFIVWKHLYDKSSFISMYSLDFLSAKEIQALEQPKEYLRFLEYNRQLFIYEMMALSKEIYGYNTLDHVCGVHALSLSIGRQLKKAGFSLDLGIVSGSATGHDIGKYGCRIKEEERVPYLHYYYTDLWFQQRNLPYIGHIAVNHSVWDLELENLSLESLILIYSDFRVKNLIEEKKMNIYSLQESFQIILQKLDNVDEKKEKRYRRVFAKLIDFEDFLIEKGINVNLIPFSDKKCCPIKKQMFFPMLHGDEIISQFKYLSLEHSFQLMFQMRNESSVNSILESARSEEDWQNLQEYLRIFSEYASYLNQNEKMITLRFLYDQLVFPEEGVRRRSAKLIGSLIATFDEEYRKEIPDDIFIESSKVKSVDLLIKYIKLFTEPFFKTSEINQRRIIESLPSMFNGLFENSRGRQIGEYLQVIKRYYKDIDYSNMSQNIAIYMIQTLKYIPIDKKNGLDVIFSQFITYFLQTGDNILRINALDVADFLLEKISNNDNFREICYSILKKSKQCSNLPVVNYLQLKIVQKIGADKSLTEQFKDYCQQDIQKIDRMYLNNLKSSTDPIIKKIQIDMLTERAKVNREDSVYIALHFCNILKVSSHEKIRNYAGRALIKIIPILNVEQKNDITIELLKALEIDDYQYTKYVPYYLGQSIPFLPPREIDEFIDDLEQKIKIADQWTCTLLIRTIAVAISRYFPYPNRYKEEKGFFEKRLTRMMGVLMNGLAHHDVLVKRVTARVIGKELFASSFLTSEDKKNIFILTAKKILNLIAPISQQNILLFFTNSVALHQLYVFISDYHFYKGQINLPIPDCIAFFPGSFDPFSLSHKEIVREIQNLGMEVYLSVDEFSWSKRTQPHLYRKNLINMSIADELNVYLYPENITSNIANPYDLKMLKKQFSQSKIYIVIGSDVLINASAYNKSSDRNSVINFPHIIFSRKPSHFTKEQQKKYLNIISKIHSDVIQLNLQAPFEEISSSQIRRNIDNHRDISDLVDPLAERYIYQFGLYQREPQYKSTLQKVYAKVEIIECITDNFIENLIRDVFPENIKEKARESLKKFNKKTNSRIILFKKTRDTEKVLGFAAIHWVRSSSFYQEFEDNIISQYIRDYATGRVIVIDGIFTVSPKMNTSQFCNLQQIILSEALTFCVRKDYDYAVYKNMLPETVNMGTIEQLELFGFTEITVGNNPYPVMAVDIRKPCTISMDVETLIKEPFVQSSRVIETIRKTRINLQKAMTQLYKGHLLIPFNIDMINQSIVSKICRENGVPSEQEHFKKLGPLMCVPFGKILHKMVVPNTVTKSLHTDKIFTPDMKHFKIDSFGYYMSLENQVKMIRSFDRPVLLIDDLLHKGYRLKALSPLLKKENIKVHKIIVGLLSGRGKELATIQKRPVEGAYFVPNLRVWFNESDLYPFIGGDGLFRTEPEPGNLVRSINMILPYAFPVFLKGVDQEIIYYFSVTCIENAIQIMKALEEEYQQIYHRKLTMGHLGEACLYPRYPDHGKNMNYNLSMATSTYLENDLELLHRIWKEGGKKERNQSILRYPHSKEFSIKKEVL